MAIFKENLKATPTIKALTKCLPDIIINPDALIKMQLFVEGCSDEIGWLGTAYKQDKSNSIYIEDVFLFNQEVHSTTTEITPEGLSEFAETILAEPNGMEIWNNLKVWGHSHVNMSVFASGQDDAQMETFSEGGHDWFIRIIANKKGDMRVDLYNYELGIVYGDLPWYESISDEERQIEEKINLLYKLLDDMKKKRTSKFTTDIKKEIEAKVKKKVSYQVGSYQVGFQGQVNTINNGKDSTKNTMKITTIDTKKKTSETKSERKTSDTEEDRIEEDEDVLEWFNEITLLDIGECLTMSQVDDILYDQGYNNFFDMLEKQIIWKVGRDTYASFYAEESAIKQK